MKRDFSTKLKNFDDTEVKEKDKFITMKDLAIIAIQSSDQEKPSGDDKWRKFELSIKLHNADVVDLTAEDAALLKRIAETSLTTLGYGRFRQFLETDYKENKKK